MAGQPCASGLDVVKGSPLPRAELAEDGAQAAQHAAPPVQVGRSGQIALAGQPVGLVAQVLAHPGEVVEDDDARPWRLAGRGGHVGRHLPAWGGDGHLGHGVLLVLPSSPAAANRNPIRCPTLEPGGRQRTDPGGAGRRPPPGAAETAHPAPASSWRSSSADKRRSRRSPAAEAATSAGRAGRSPRRATDGRPGTSAIPSRPGCRHGIGRMIGTNAGLLPTPPRVGRGRPLRRQGRRIQGRRPHLRLCGLVRRPRDVGANDDPSPAEALRTRYPAIRPTTISTTAGRPAEAIGSFPTGEADGVRLELAEARSNADLLQLAVEFVGQAGPSAGRACTRSSRWSSRTAR
jgi:hypothetical protein